jgi:formylmethanofuran dehydrogenase subunit A
MQFPERHDAGARARDRGTVEAGLDSEAIKASVRFGAVVVSVEGDDEQDGAVDATGLRVVDDAFDLHDAHAAPLPQRRESGVARSTRPNGMRVVLTARAPALPRGRRFRRALASRPR